MSTEDDKKKTRKRPRLRPPRGLASAAASL